MPASVQPPTGIVPSAHSTPRRVSAWDDTTSAARSTTARIVVALVSVQFGRTTSWPPTMPMRLAQCWNCIKRGLQQQRIVDVRCREHSRERDATAVDDDMAFAPWLAPVSRIGTGCLAPLLAGTLAESNEARPVDLAPIRQALQHLAMQAFPHASAIPVSEAPPTRHPTPTAQLLRQELPANASLEHKDDACQHLAVVESRASALRLGRFSRQQWRNDRP
jgi:hypothetical protein